ncbi:hypothetical protein ACD631_17925 [Alteromonas macleodii]|uniref:hypothetical protein n=1 Tax=Alteromonas macleodii TaxID=28108 RepID=UPI002076BD4A|nr:hypothetical protein [Alteromonas macleodii]USI28220.1 hypothetical protein NFG60_00610 [Alteromonas macleodii]
MENNVSILSSSWCIEYDKILQTMQSRGEVCSFDKFDELDEFVDKKGKLVLIYTSFYDFVENLTARETSFTRFLESWVAHATQLVNFARINRSKIILVSSRDTAINRTSFENISGVSLSELEVPNFSSSTKLLANYTSQVNADVRKLLELLDALTTPLSEGVLLSETSAYDVEVFLQTQEKKSAELSSEIFELTKALTSTQEALDAEKQAAKKLEAMIFDLNNSLLEEESFNKYSLSTLSEFDSKITTLKNALEESEFDKRRYRRQRDRVEKKNQKIEEELSLLKVVLSTKDNELKRNAELLGQYEADTLVAKKSAIASTKINERQKKSLEAKVNELQKSNDKLFAELSLIRKENDGIKRSRLYSAGQVIKKAKNKLNRDELRLDDQEISLVATSEYFNIKWYLETYPDVAEAGVHPVEHYLLYGAAEGRLPSPNFDGKWYLIRYPDVEKAGLNPLVHYETYGKGEGRVVSPKMLESEVSSKKK